MLTEVQEEIRCSARAFAARELVGESGEKDFDGEGWAACARYGVMGITVPREYGGREQSLAEFAAMLEGLASGTRRLGVLFAISAHVFGAVEPICAAGTESQKRKYLPKLASGQWVAAHGVTEPNSGSDISDIQTTASADASGWVIDGTKQCITCGTAADLHVVYARNEGNGLACFLIDPDTPGVTVRAMEPVGLRGCGLANVIYNNVKVPAENVLGQVGAGRAIFQGSIERERACIFGFAVGAMQRGLDEAVEYANSRVIGGSPIAVHQAVSHRIADMKIRLEVSRLLLYRVAALKARGKRAPVEAATAKLYISESFVENSIALLRVFGGKGYTREGGVEQFVRDALGGLVLSGTNDIQRNIIARFIGLKT